MHKLYPSLCITVIVSTGTFWSTVWSTLKITVLSTDKWNTLTVINISYKYTYMYHTPGMALGDMLDVYSCCVAQRCGHTAVNQFK